MSTIDATIVIRRAEAEDDDAIGRLADLDSAPAPAGDMLVAEVGGEMRAAVSLDGGGLIADPFHRTADMLALLELRADQLRSGERRRQKVAMRTPAYADGWRSTGLREAWASSSRRTGVV
jgi:hypothetical protein